MYSTPLYLRIRQVLRGVKGKAPQAIFRVWTDELQSLLLNFLIKAIMCDYRNRFYLQHYRHSPLCRSVGRGRVTGCPIIRARSTW